MLDPAQIEIGGRKIVTGFGGDPAVFGEFDEHVEGPGAAQLRPASAKDQLLRLDEEFDLADAAASEFDVMAGNGDFGMSAHCMDLALHRMNVGDRRVIEIFAPDESGQIGEETAAPALCRRPSGRALMRAARSQFWPSVS